MILKTINLTQKYGDHTAVDGINMDIEKGSLTAVLGPNGAGKSTTMRMLTGIRKPSSGDIIYAPNTTIGVVFQSSVLDNQLTVKENLMIRAKQYRQVGLKQVEILIHDLGLTQFSGQLYGTLSGGQKRRVDIARALLNNPDILFLDEPTTGLDIQTRLAIWQLLHDLQQSRQLTIVLTTHYLDEADYAQQVYVVDHGQIIASGSANQIKQRYASNQLTLFTPDARSLSEKLPDNIGSQVINEHEILIKTGNATEAISLITQHQSILTNFEYRLGTMDDAFVALTGKEMR
ncbi:ABC transporter ATP-binding protein [Leuconostoc pseudomesenteroides]|uniref:ABC transporter ATP-binding protein n=2 Tax=Leuconostoc pseudomesenteroides TaxID=33968 RepID=A0A5B8T1Z2_LEUPS|nr:ABC transporter ATP-binding protein [Leuconostoc pseudomesenteroides]MCC8439588.1 ABC transporter ATP-binding protein [Leuconostoc pseudomesenteroides]NKZ35927.1 ABC transporter ATP-binding protein [Leuconostoc pseudomesenteroides]QEA42467.1 ABC transporter ATP-binding protein [Leuconostoc pseudomesenteroides]